MDAGVISLYFAGRPKVKPYFDRILSGRAEGVISEVNLAEFFYKAAQTLGVETAEVRYAMLRQGKFKIIPTDDQITKGAGLWKVKQPALSLADCFALSTLDAKAETLLTSDEPLSKVRGIVAVYFPTS